MYTYSEFRGAPNARSISNLSCACPDYRVRFLILGILH